MLPFVLVFRSQSVLKRNYFTSIFHYAFFSFSFPRVMFHDVIPTFIYIIFRNRRCFKANI